MDPMSSAYWLHLKDRLDDGYHLHPSEATKAALWVIIVMFPLAIILHLATAYKRAQLGGFWLLRLDTEGYLQENRNVLVPILSAFKTAVGLTCVISLQYDIHTHFHTVTLILQVLAYVAMHSLNWMRTWGSVYSMPPASFFNFNQKRTKSPFQKNDRIFPPWLFNSFIFIGLLYGVLLATISLKLMCTCIHRVDHLYHILSHTLDENISLSQNLTPDSRQLIKHNASFLHEGIQEIESESAHLFWLMQLLVICFLGINFLSCTIFWWSLHTIIRCLNSQLEAYSRSLRNRSEAIQLGMVSERQTTFVNSHEVPPSSDLQDYDSLEWKSQERKVNTTNESIAGSWRAWLPTLQRNTVVSGPFLWKSPLMGQVAQQGPNKRASLRRQYALLRRFKTNTLWQAIFITLMAFNYQSMGITLKVNPYDVPTSMSTADVGMIVVLWSNLIWAIGGTGVAALAAVVAYSGTPTDDQKKVDEVQMDDAKSFDY